MLRRPVVILKRLMYTKVEIIFVISVTGGQTEMPVGVTKCVAITIFKNKTHTAFDGRYQIVCTRTA